MVRLSTRSDDREAGTQMARGGRGFQGTVLKALRVPEHKLTVTGVRELAPYTELTVH